MSLRIIDGGANTPLAGLVAGTLGVVLSRRVIGRFPGGRSAGAADRSRGG